MSKRLHLFSVLALLLSACTFQVGTVTSVPETVEPVVSNTSAVNPVATSTPLVLAGTDSPLPTVSFPDTPSVVSACPGAAAPRVAPGQQVLVLADDTDKLKLRSEPEISSDTVIMELDQFTWVKILEGFKCVHSDETGNSYWFWKVVVVPTGEIGWVAEGDSSHYFIGSAAGRPLPSFEGICPGAPAPHVAIGQEVTVVANDEDKLKLRSEPRISSDNVIRELDKLTHLKILDSFVCVHAEGTSYWFWEVEVMSTGEVGWVAEGNSSYYFIE